MSNIVPFKPLDSSPFHQPALTMSSLEIAELTGTEHKNVKSDIRAMLEALELNRLSFEHVYVDGKGEQRPCFHLPKNLTITFVSGYSMVLRARIVDRWLELEEEAAKAPVRAPAVAPPAGQKITPPSRRTPFGP